MSADIITNLPELIPQSNKRLSPVITALLQSNEEPSALVNYELVSNAKWVVTPKKGVASLLNPQNRQVSRRTLSFSIANKYTMEQLNTGLLGGESYPVLTAVLGTAVGIASFGSGLLFTVATTGLSMMDKAQRVLARSSDEIWNVEVIGRIGRQPTYVSSYFIVDPYRAHTPNKGWLIHEERHNVSLS